LEEAVFAGTEADAGLGTRKRDRKSESSNRKIIGIITTSGATMGSATGVMSSAKTKMIK
jgi:hypothetical protein